MKPILALVVVLTVTLFFGSVAYGQLRSLRNASAQQHEVPNRRDMIEVSQPSHVELVETEGHFAPSPSPSPIPSEIYAEVKEVLGDMLPEDHVERGIRMEVLSWEPRAFVVENLLSPEECDEMIARAEPKMEPSTVVDVSNGKSIGSSVRTSTGAFLTDLDFQRPITSKDGLQYAGESETYRRVTERLARLTMTPVENGEALQILRYEPGQYYRPHNDWFADQFNKDRGGQRIATVLMYLSDVEDGGETVFPNAGDAGEKAICGGKEGRGRSVKAKKGRAVIFWNCHPNYREDPKSLHGGCTVLSGTKWSATRWIRSGKFV
mmetsp:Transcript_14099/g.17088  ORF Transcript_14099/g.17088 Transcript_14099/m.17088 type:complete len:321 (+) Transcript_14099:228-1190(+)|eukprot:CAMPEP_0197847674 /NCGR_PEP_ID=MMETSP1438-20131217/6757_1 /TAXON_ID=1461541 /ORGANISM="Pterosperma sp., Strain CCMP1384" /LENGTH=320 /DNA_ID=CAMNT_0043459665 /DNA_START=227 /DNA_END=1189 /DNA_ORIENTATION=+